MESWTAQSADFGKFYLNSLNLALFLLLNPVFLVVSEGISTVVSDSPHRQRAQAAQGHEQPGHAVSVCQDEGDCKLQ